MGDSQHEQMSLVLLERDQARKALNGGLADKRDPTARARPCRTGFGHVSNSSEGNEDQACGEDEGFLPVVNSPRMGVCGYTGKT
jgi:hypothetical protein